ncbi:MAG: DNA primase [Candidatus Improbicoccus pseudotrichonymphae]|uniref:DNA primase n=1 Tax=Candidatus Improbicoccus pseudotrichonymphae TaxID=3033792 RepID=A0AA48HUM1_9FIRM|nr:MAG: DNA primase [Candidatus Improbicoccus pseudotrichonymphae]
MKISSSDLEKIKENNSIYDVVSSYLSLKNKGRNFSANCPFHQERTPSFFVYPDSNSFYCFGCNTGGDVITFIRLIENLDYVEAVAFLAKRAGISIEENKDFYNFEPKKNIIYEINRKSAVFFHSNLFKEKNKPALDYLISRKLEINTVKHFGIGCAFGHSRFELINYLKSQNYKESDILAADLAYKTRNNNIIDKFFNRIIFPIIDLNGNVIGFGGRSVNENNGAKYINTSDTIVFKKSKNLYSLNFAKKSRDKQVILTEGYMDVISLYQAGFTNAVASLGTALTSEHANLIIKYFENIYISYDSDEAGKKATRRAIEIFKKYDISTKIVSIQKFKDPDDLVNKSGSKSNFLFKKFIENSQNDVWYIISEIRNKFNIENYEEKIKFLNEVSKVISKIDNTIDRDIYTLKICAETGINKQAFENQIKKLIKKRNKLSNINKLDKTKEIFKQKPNYNNKSKYFRIYYIEKILLSCIIKYGACLWDVFSSLKVSDFASDFAKSVFGRILELKENNEKIDIINVSKNFDFKQNNELARVFGIFSDSTFSKDEVVNYVKILKMEGRYIELQKCSSDISDIRKYINILKSDKNKFIDI